jgi:glycosyltransferase involved in cell wall biosynthesis
VGELLASVIVPVRNDRGRHLQTLLDALSRQTLPREQFEVVIGDDGSTDGSTAGLETPDGWVRVVCGPATNSYAARNRAARASRAPILAFCDSDCVPEPEWLEGGIRVLERQGAVRLAAGAIRFIVPDRKTIWTLIDVDTTKDHERSVKNGNAETANLFVPRELFDRVRGFDDSIPEHGDFDFTLRCVDAGADLAYARESLLWHPTRNDGRAFLRMLWVMHRWYAAREARAGRKPLGLKLRWWVPFVFHMRWRRESGRSIGLDRRWLSENGMRPRLADNLRAIPIMYLFLPYYTGAAQIRGWWDGRALRRRLPKLAQSDLDLAGPGS